VRSAAKVESNKMLVGPERSDLNSRVDTCVVGASYQVLELVGPTCDVHPYSTEYALIKNMPIVTAATAYDSATGETYILIVNQALSIPDQQPSLLCLNQLRSNGVVVDKVPMHLSKNSTHSIYFPELDLRLPLELDGVISFLPTRIPSEREMVECRHLQPRNNLVIHSHK
jgi:hypothetical protein